jgi:hypothetical protein
VAHASRLAELITRRRDDLVAAWEAGARTLASGARAPRPALVDRVPALLGWLAEHLEGDADEAQRDAFSQAHTVERVARGFDLVEILAEWGLLRDVLLEAWEAEPEGITAAEVRRMNAELDHVIALSVVQYVRAERAGAPAAGPAVGAGAG